MVSANDRSSGLAFQLAADYRAPDWPDPARPQQLHLDVMVDDLDEAEPLVLALGARRLPAADPSGAGGGCSPIRPAIRSASSHGRRGRRRCVPGGRAGAES